MSEYMIERLQSIQRALWEEVEKGIIQEFEYTELCNCLKYLESIASGGGDVIQYLRDFGVIRGIISYYRETYNREWDRRKKHRDRKEASLWNNALNSLVSKGFTRPTKEQIFSLIVSEAKYQDLSKSADEFERIAWLTNQLYATVDQQRSILEQIANTERHRERQNSEGEGT